MIGFCDADDTYEKNALETIAFQFDKNPDVDCIVTGYTRIVGNHSYSVRKRKKRKWSKSQFLHHILCDERVMGTVWNKFFRKQRLQNVLFPEQITCCEDVYYLYGVVCKLKNKVLVLEQPLYNYYDNSNSITNTISRIFDEEDNLNYFVTLESVIRDYRPNYYWKTLVYGKELIIALETRNQFALSEKQYQKVNYMIKKRWFYMFMHPFAEGIKSIKLVLYGVIHKLN